MGPIRSGRPPTCQSASFGSVTRSTCELFLLGQFSARVEDRVIPKGDWKRKRPAELVKLLGLQPNRRLHREQLMEAMWPQAAPDSAAGNLRKAVHFARQRLGQDAISSTGGVIELWPDTDVTVDALAFERAAKQALSSPDPAHALAAARLSSGELLPDDRYAPWADEPRHRLRLLAVQVMKKAELWDLVLEIDPADEDAHGALMRSALDAGDRTAAIRQFEKLRERLRIDLGVGPSPETVGLYEQALAGMDEVSADGPLRIRHLLARAFVEMNGGQLDAAEEKAEQARKLAVAAGLAIEFNEATAMLSIMSTLRGRWRELFRSEFAEALSSSDNVASRVFDAHVCVTEYHLHGPAGLDGLTEYAEELRESAEKSGSARAQAVAELLAGEAMVFAGDLRSAETHLEASIRLHEQAGANGGKALAMQRLAQCALAEGEMERARHLLNDGLELARSSPLAPHLIARMHEGLVASSDDGDVLLAVRSGEIELEDQMICPACSVGFWFSAARALVGLGEVELAEQHLGRVDEIATMWPDGSWHAAVIEGRGLIARAKGDEASAVGLLEEAAKRYGSVGRIGDQSRCRDVIRAASGSASS